MMFTDSDVKIIVATHRQYDMPQQSIYLPVLVGAAQNKAEVDYAKDNTGDNISELNPYFCELTGLYWAWKNLDASYVGLVHYRRHFALRKTKNALDGVLSFDDIKQQLGKIKVFVPKRRRYYIETLYSHYLHTMKADHLDKAREIIAKRFPDYSASFERAIMKSTSGYMFNMTVMEKGLLNSYCEWLFDILFELKEQVDVSSLTAFEARLFGRVSERLFNVWLDYQIQSGKINKSEIKELPYIYFGKVNWYKKITSFVKAKLGGNGYKESF